MNYDDFFVNAIDGLKAAGNYREFTNLERLAGNYPHAKNHSIGREITLWCSNDYLGMGQHPDVAKAICETVQKIGSGAGGTRNIAGTSRPLVELESELASLHNKEAAAGIYIRVCHQFHSIEYTGEDAEYGTILRCLEPCIND